MAQLIADFIQRVTNPQAIDQGMMLQFRDSIPTAINSSPIGDATPENIKQFQHPVMRAILQVRYNRFKEIYETLAQLAIVKDSTQDIVTGVHLDNIGKIVGQDRIASAQEDNIFIFDSEDYCIDKTYTTYVESPYINRVPVDDVQYKKLLAARKLTNTQKGFSVNNLLDQLDSIFPGEIQAVTVTPTGSMSFNVELTTDLSNNELSILEQTDINNNYLLRYPSGYSISAVNKAEINPFVFDIDTSSLDTSLIYE